MKKLTLAFLLLFSFPVMAQYQAPAAKGIAMHGAPRYGWNFKNFDYANPDAPKGGTLRMSAYGSFDTFNPYVIKGVAAAGTGLLFDTLMVESADEPFSEYGVIAETIEMPKDRSWVAFNINRKARFSDGTPITAQDVVFSFNLLKTKGLPMFGYYYGNVESVEEDKPMRVLFKFKEGDNRELPLILGHDFQIFLAIIFSWGQSLLDAFADTFGQFCGVHSSAQISVDTRAESVGVGGIFFEEEAG